VYLHTTDIRSCFGTTCVLLTYTKAKEILSQRDNLLSQNCDQLN
jgi:hypothetical protein